MSDGRSVTAVTAYVRRRPVLRAVGVDLAGARASRHGQGGVAELMPQGSRSGERRGVRQKGTPHRATLERRLRAQSRLAAARLGVLTLDNILTAVAVAKAADEIIDHQLQASIAAAPSVHPRPTGVAVKDMTPPPDTAAHEEARKRLVADLDDLARPEPLTIEAEVMPTCVERPTLRGTAPTPADQQPQRQCCAPARH